MKKDRIKRKLLTKKFKNYFSGELPEEQDIPKETLRLTCNKVPLMGNILLYFYISVQGGTLKEVSLYKNDKLIFFSTKQGKNKINALLDDSDYYFDPVIIPYSKASETSYSISATYGFINETQLSDYKALGTGNELDEYVTAKCYCGCCGGKINNCTLCECNCKGCKNNSDKEDRQDSEEPQKKKGYFLWFLG